MKCLNIIVSNYSQKFPNTYTWDGKKEKILTNI